MNIHIPGYGSSHLSVKNDTLCISDEKVAYIPYSIRHDIGEGDMGLFLDYCERDIGLDIKANGAYEDIEFSYELGDARINFWQDGEVQFMYRHIELRIPKELFFRTYKSLFPAIRDLYMKK